jgi:acylpyruvate hydrolase
LAGLDLLRIVLHGPQSRVGALVGDTIVDLALASATHGGQASGPALPSDLAGFIEAGDAGLDRAREVISRALASDDAKAIGAVVALGQHSLRPPAVARPRIACAAGNYAAHTPGSAAHKGVPASRALTGLVAPGQTDLPTAAEVVERTRERGIPRGFWKDFALPMGPESEIPFPRRAERFDYEGEVAVVLGRPARDVAPGTGATYLWGVTLLNDWSIRGASQKDSLSFNLSKNFDGGASVGPCIVVGGLDPAGLRVQTRVNGELRQDYDSADMIFSHAEYLEYLSRDFTLLPGDIISGGSGPGSATDAAKGDPPDLSLFLRIGDVVEVSADPIGTLRNRVVAR